MMMGGRAAPGSGPGTTESGALPCECLDARENVSLARELDDLAERHRRGSIRRKANRESSLRRRLRQVCHGCIHAAYYSFVGQIVSDDRREL
jgi:hypothetical protein